ncbi:MAG: tyrosine-protein phosphatase [Prevotella sp.]|nr:tyrosine-protein phosphatase [Prevotella sp.]
MRSGKLAKATDADVAVRQDQYHLSDVFDFHFNLEMSEAPDRVISGVAYTQVSTMPQKFIEAQAEFGAGSGQLSTAGVVDVLMKYAFDSRAQEMVKQLYPAIVTDPQSQANYGEFLHGVLAA